MPDGKIATIDGVPVMLTQAQFEECCCEGCPDNCYDCFGTDMSFPFVEDDIVFVVDGNTYTIDISLVTLSRETSTSCYWAGLGEFVSGSPGGSKFFNLYFYYDDFSDCWYMELAADDDSCIITYRCCDCCCGATLTYLGDTNATSYPTTIEPLDG